MNPELDHGSTSLLGDTLRATAFMIVPVIAFLAILSAVALFAVPRPGPGVKEADPTAVEQPAPHPAPNARAAIRPSKI
jgi:hypothetical protein